MLGLLVGVGGEDPRGDRHLRCLEAPTGLEVRGVVLRHRGAAGVDEVGEGVGQAELRGPHRRLQRAAEQPGLWRFREPGQTAGEAREGVVGRERALEVAEESLSWG